MHALRHILHLSVLLGVAHGFATSFETQGRKIMIQTPSNQWEVFKIRGFAYSNARIGEGPPTDESSTGYDSLMRPDLCKRDFDAMRTLNANAIKVYAYNVLAPNSWALHKECFDYAWNGGLKPIFLDLSIWINGLPMTSADLNITLNGYRKMVQDTAHHPAVFAYAIGSEFGGDANCAPSLDVRNCAYWQQFKALTSVVRQALGSNKKLITTATWASSCSNPQFCSTMCSLGHVINGEHAGADVDFWGVDIYSPTPGTSWLRQNLFNATKKPFFMPEYGVSYQPTTPGTDSDKSLQEFTWVQELERFSYTEGGQDGNHGDVYEDNSPIYAGGLLFEWSDEYWKGPAGSLPCHAAPGNAQGWFGKMKLRLKPGCACVHPEQRSEACAVDELVPRPILSNSTLLPTLWNAYVPRAYASGAPGSIVV